MDVNERAPPIYTKEGPWTLYDFGGVRITAKYIHEDTLYKISMFGRGFYFNPLQFQILVNSKGIENLTENMEKVRPPMIPIMEDNDGHFIVMRALQEAKKRDHDIIHSSE